MTKENFSLQRSLILDEIKASKAHPDAEWIYRRLKPAHPKLSLATVYRNISRFKERGLVVSIATVAGHDRIDGNVSPHPHFICDECGAVIDVEVDCESLCEKLAEERAERCEIIFHGKCHKCRNAALNLN